VEYEYYGLSGTIKSWLSNSYVAVEYDSPFDGGWDCEGTCKDKQGWYTPIKSLVLENNKLEEYIKKIIKDEEVKTRVKKIKILKM